MQSKPRGQSSGVVQVGLAPGSAEETECHLLDITALRDLSPLGRLLADGDVEKVLHDAQQDLFILRRATGASPRAVFDTRLAAGFGDLGCSTSLHRLIQQLLGVELSKGAQRTNWLQRPLSDRQIAYAENDVRHLIAARDALMQRARQRDNEQWLRQELDLLDAPERYGERPAREQYARIKGALRLQGQRLAVLREVAEYREEEARRRNLPRAWLFTDATLLSLARHQPTTLAGLEEIKGLGAKAIQHRGEALLEHVARGAALPAEGWPPPVRRPGRRKVSGSELDRAVALMERRCAQRGIDPALVASRTELRTLLGDGRRASAEQHHLLEGWRAELVGEELLQML